MPAPVRPPAVGPRPGSAPEDERRLANAVRTACHRVLSIDGGVMSVHIGVMSVDIGVMSIGSGVVSAYMGAM